MKEDFLIRFNDPILVTGAKGFIGSRVVEKLKARGFNNLRCFARGSSAAGSLRQAADGDNGSGIEWIRGNLISPDDCRKATDGVSVIFNLAAGIEKTFAGCFMNSVLTTRNLLEASLGNKRLKRFVNVSSFAVYSNYGMKRGQLLDETCEIEKEFMQRADAYCFAKTKQDQIVMEYGAKENIPFVIIRPGVVYGPNARAPIHSRVGIGTFGIFLHLGGANRVPLTYVDNCAEGIVLAGITKGIDGQVFNIVDDFLPTSRTFLKMYKKKVKYFKSIYIPYRISYLLCYLWEKYARWSHGQLPPAFNRRKCSAEWKGNRYSNAKAKKWLGWTPTVSVKEGMERHFEYFRRIGSRNA